MRRLLPSLAVLSLLAPSAHAVPLKRSGWLKDVMVTQYYPVPESWFTGALVWTPGIGSVHRVDWLYSARGVMMEGDGVGLDGKQYHLDAGYGLPWVNLAGVRTAPGPNGWTAGPPVWKAWGWRNARGAVTYPLSNEGGGATSAGWSNGRARRKIRVPKAIRFARGPSMPLAFWRSAAVDPSLIPLGSRIFIRSYCATIGKGWVTAVDTGSAIGGRHIDVYRRPPKSIADQGVTLSGQPVYVIPKGAKPPRRLPSCPKPVPPPPV